MQESYTAPPHGGNRGLCDLGVAGNRRRPGLVLVGLAGPGAVTVFFMMDQSEAAYGGFPEGTNGVAALETRDTRRRATSSQWRITFIRCAGDHAVDASGRRPDAGVHLAGLSGIINGEQSQVSAALTTLFLQKESRSQPRRSR